MAVSGYASKTSVRPGTGEDATIRFHLSAPDGTYSISVQNILSDTPALILDNVSITQQPPPSEAGWEGFGWPCVVGLTIPAGSSAIWPTGIYHLKCNGDVLAPFVVLPEHPGSSSRILMQAVFITPQAYNEQGGKSLYSDVATVSFDRPMTLRDDDLAFALWLKENGYNVEFCSSLDIHDDPTLLANYDCMITVGHDEYWTWEMCDNVERFVADGGNVVVLSGNTCFRQVRLEPNAAGAKNRMIVCYKNATDPVADRRKTTVAFAQPPVNRPANTFLGAGWCTGAYYGIGPLVPFEIYFPNHRYFQGLDFGPLGPSGRPRTSSFLTYETDAASFVLDEGGSPYVTGVDGTPSSTVVLAGADLSAWYGKPGWATMTLLSNNGRVFHAGTTAWVAAMRSDPNIATITRRVLADLGSRQWIWEHIGAGVNIVGMAACQGKLFCATSDNRLWRRHPVGAETGWLPIGHANDVRTLAALGDTLFAVTGNNQLWWRTTAESDVRWTPNGSGPEGGTLAMVASGSVLYAVATDGNLYYRPASRGTSDWRRVGLNPSLLANNPRIKAMAAHNGVLLAATTEGRLVRNSSELIEESTAWIDVGECNSCGALAVVDGMLFCSTTGNKLWRLDLRGLHRNHGRNTFREVEDVQEIA